MQEEDHRNKCHKLCPSKVPSFIYLEHLSCEDENDPVPDILAKLEETYKENKESLNKSMLHLILKVCGLSELISKLNAEHINESLSDALTAFA